MRVTFFIIALIAIFTACDRVKQTAKTTISKTGETVGRTTTEFADGVSAGIDKTYQSQLTVSGELQKAGLRTGRFSIAGTDSSRNNMLTAYLIFDQDFHKDLLIKVMDRNGVEYGRVKQTIVSKKGEANYYDFIFNKRTQIESKSTFLIE
jgi:hypothetical protein